MALWVHGSIYFLVNVLTPIPCHHLQVFEPFGPVELVQLPIDIESGQSKGFGFVQVGVSYFLYYAYYLFLQLLPVVGAFDFMD